MPVHAEPEVRWRQHTGTPDPWEPCTCQALSSYLTNSRFIGIISNWDLDTFRQIVRLLDLFGVEQK